MQERWCSGMCCAVAIARSDWLWCATDLHGAFERGRQRNQRSASERCHLLVRSA
jgi:hypothetical protein